MKWLENYNRKVIFYDVLLLDPYSFSNNSVGSLKKELNNFKIFNQISFSQNKHRDLISLYLWSLMQDFSFSGKVYFEKMKGMSGKKTYRLHSFSSKNKAYNFFDFFLSVVVKSLKRRYIVPKVSSNYNGVLNVRFSSISELELDDFFFFDLYQWSGFFNMFIYFSSDHRINNLLCNYYKNIFKLY